MMVEREMTPEEEREERIWHILGTVAENPLQRQQAWVDVMTIIRELALPNEKDKNNSGLQGVQESGGDKIE